MSEANEVDAMVSPEFVRETRYFVLKISDIRKFLTSEEVSKLAYIGGKVDAERQKEGRGFLTAVVVEHDWPEYEPTWAAIEKRMKG